MHYEVAPLFCRPWTLNGITPKLIESHYENNYGACVARLNAISHELRALDRSAASPQIVYRLKQEQAETLSSALLHELYFASLGGDGRNIPEAMAAVIARDFGSVDSWRNEFMSMATALDGRSGWVLLAWAPRLRRLINLCVGDACPMAPGCIPVLVLDMYEHAYHLDFGANASAYIAAFMRNIDWNAVEARYLDAAAIKPPRALEQEAFAALPSITVAEVSTLQRTGAPVQIIDVRPQHYSSKATDMMAGAVWRDPERVDEWIGARSKDTPIVTFCVYGFHIGCETTAKLREAGFDARYMAGGHSAWKASRGAVKLFRSDTPPETSDE